jgi:uncharacterized protein YndB with AHSA1/START domain
MLEVEILIEAQLKDVWSYFTTSSNWQEWWGAQLAKVEPRWEEGATLVWGNGNHSEISAFVEFKLIQIRGQWMQTAFSFNSNGDQKTQIQVKVIPLGGAQFNDGGASHRKQTLSELQKLKAAIELSRPTFRT